MRCINNRVGNCLLFAPGRWFCFGGQVQARKSDFGWWPHFLWTLDGTTFEEYIPPVPNGRLLLPPPLYSGVIRTFTK
jgi:hypothetical protein